MSGNDDFYLENASLLEVEAWDGEYSSVEPGEYEAEVAEIERKAKKAGEGTNLRTVYEVVANADGSDTDQKGRKAFAHYPESGKGLGRLKQFLTAAGVPINERGGYNAGAALGKRVLITVTAKDYTTESLDGTKTTKSGMQVGNERPAQAAAPPPKAMGKKPNASAPARAAR